MELCCSRCDLGLLCALHDEMESASLTRCLTDLRIQVSHLNSGYVSVWMVWLRRHPRGTWPQGPLQQGHRSASKDRLKRPAVSGRFDISAHCDEQDGRFRRVSRSLVCWNDIIKGHTPYDTPLKRLKTSSGRRIRNMFFLDSACSSDPKRHDNTFNLDGEVTGVLEGESCRWVQAPLQTARVLAGAGSLRPQAREGRLRRRHDRGHWRRSLEVRRGGRAGWQAPAFARCLKDHAPSRFERDAI